MKIRLLMLLTPLLILASCSAIYENREEDKHEAQKIINSFYENLKPGEYQKTFGLFTQDFFKVTATKKLERLCQQTDSL